MFLILCLLPIENSFSSAVIKWSGKRHRVIKKYLKIHQKFTRKLCGKSDDHKHGKLFRNYKAAGFFIPLLENDTLDTKSIRASIRLIENKKLFIDGQINGLKNSWNPRKSKKIIKKIKRVISKLLDYKKNYFRVASGKKSMHDRSARKIIELADLLGDLLASTPFLKGFGFPVDHLEYRKRYDESKKLSGNLNKMKSNKIYFARTAYEDGASDTDQTHSDVYLRTAINTLALSLKNAKAIITENIRVDTKYVISGIERQLRRGKNVQRSRLKAWKKKVTKAISFYNGLLNDFEYKKEVSDKFLKLLTQTRYQLLNFTLKKNSDVFKFWNSQKDLFKALFVLETILYNEVGGIDGQAGLERRDVAKVVINRLKDPSYNQLKKSEPLREYLAPLSSALIDKDKWLSVLFKEGEFSFTYYFIQASVRTYCPDLSRRGRFLRRENLKISLDALAGSNGHFEGLRYFSRASMRGRIDMASLWEGFNALPERAGGPLRSQKHYHRLYQKGSLKYLYTFIDDNKKAYDVLELGKKLVLRGKELGHEVFYSYRNPHLFTYFAPRK